MSLYIICILIILAVLAAACTLIWRKNRKQPFRARLTIVFLLFVAAPSIPLTMITASLLSGSARILMPDQISDALVLSMDCLKSQIAEQGLRFLRENPRPENWTDSSLVQNRIQGLSLYRLDHSAVQILSREQSGSAIPEQIRQLPDFHLRDRYRFGESSRLIPSGKQDWVILYKSHPDSMLIVLFYKVDPGLSGARRRIESALTMVNTLSLLKESILQKNIIWALAVILISGLLLLTWTVSRRLSRGMTQPINALVKGMEQVAAGHLTYQVRVRARDEFKYLVDQFNTMTRDLHDTHQKLIETERLAAWQSVARQISHEIRNSLTPISLSLHRIRKRLDGAGDQKILESLDIIDEELNLLNNMASSFSEFARMPEPNMTPVSLSDTAKASSHLLQAAFPDIRFHEKYDESLPLIEADQDQLKRMINNLIKNSTEAVRNMGDIWIETRRDEGSNEILLSIEDNGAGIPEAIIQKVFDPYFTTKERGTGLGLAMVKRMVEAHHGTIVIRNRPRGGTSVILRFPAA